MKKPKRPLVWRATATCAAVSFTFTFTFSLSLRGRVGRDTRVGHVALGPAALAYGPLVVQKIGGHSDTTTTKGNKTNAFHLILFICGLFWSDVALRMRRQGKLVVFQREPRR